MKKNYYFVLLTLLATLLFGCQDPETPVTYTLETNLTALSFDTDGDIKEIEVTSNTDWAISVADTIDWLTISPLSSSGDKTVTVTTTDNKATNSRTATLTFSATGTDNVVVTVSQAGIEESPLEISITETVQLGYDQSSFTFDITTSSSWVVTASQDGQDADWLTIFPNEGDGNGTVKVTATENSGDESRSATVVVTSSDSATASFDIVQQPLNADPDAIINFADDNILDAIINSTSHTPTVIDTNGDGAVSYGEAALVTKLRLNSDNIFSFDEVKYFTELEELWLSYNYVDELILTNNTKLNTLYCEGNYMSVLDVSNNPELAYLYCYNNSIEELDLTMSTKLVELDYNNNLVSEAKLPDSPSLKKLNCYSNEIRDIDVTGYPNLTIYNCYANYLTSVDVSQNTLLEYFDCSTNLLSTIDVSNNTKLLDLDCRNNQITSLDVSSLVNSVTGIDCSINRIVSLDVSECKNLYTLTCGSQVDPTTQNDIISIITINAIQYFRNLAMYGNTNISREVIQGPIEVTSETTYDEISVSTQMNSYSGNYALCVSQASVIWDLEEVSTLALSKMFYELLENKNVDFTKADNTYIFDSNVTDLNITGWDITANNTQHVICAIPLTSSGEIDLNIEPTVIYDTTQMKDVDEDFTVSFEVTDIVDNHCTVTFIPSDQTAVYNGSIWKSSDLEGYSDTEIMRILPMQTNFFTDNKIGTTTITYYYLPASTMITLLGCALDSSFTPYKLFKYEFVSAAYSPASFTSVEGYKTINKLDPDVEIPYSNN